MGKSSAGKYCEIAAKRLSQELLEATLHSQVLFLRRYLEQLVHVPVKDERGHIVNGFAAAQIPDWAIKQQIEDIEAALAKVRWAGG